MADESRKILKGFDYSGIVWRCGASWFFDLRVKGFPAGGARAFPSAEAAEKQLLTNVNSVRELTADFDFQGGS